MKKNEEMKFLRNIAKKSIIPLVAFQRWEKSPYSGLCDGKALLDVNEE